MGQESAEADAGVREGFSTSFARRSRWLERELKELHRASERLKLASALFDFAELNRWILDRYRDTFGLENPLTNDCYWPVAAYCECFIARALPVKPDANGWSNTMDIRLASASRAMSGCFRSVAFVNVSLVTTRSKNVFSKLVFGDMTAGSGWFQAGPIK